MILTPLKFFSKSAAYRWRQSPPKKISIGGLLVPPCFTGPCTRMPLTLSSTIMWKLLTYISAGKKIGYIGGASCLSHNKPHNKSAKFSVHNKHWEKELFFISALQDGYAEHYTSWKKWKMYVKRLKRLLPWMGIEPLTMLKKLVELSAITTQPQELDVRLPVRNILEF